MLLAWRKKDNCHIYYLVILVAKWLSGHGVVLCVLECAAHEFRCYLSGLCVDIGRWCDGHRDCPDSSDEPDTCQNGGWSNSITVAVIIVGDITRFGVKRFNMY